MVKLNLTVLFSFLLFVASAQTLKPIAQMVAEAGLTNELSTAVDFFSPETGNLHEQPELAAVLKDGRLLRWDAAQAEKMLANAGRPIALRIPLGEKGDVELQLVPAKNFSDGFEVRTASDNLVQEVERGLHYWGIVKDDPNSLVTISIFKNELMGSIAVDGAQYTIGLVPESTDHTHIIYKSSDLEKGNPFECMTDEKLHQIGEKYADEAESRSVGPNNCVRVYVEADYTLFQNKGSVANVTTYLTGVFSQVSALYANESINLVLHTLVVWNVADPYTGPSASNYLTQFRTALGGVFNGDIAHLVGIHGLGGVAYVDVLCNSAYAVGYSSINATYSNVPVYSWTVEVLTHEMGHNLGSSHTHACVWNGNNTAIDGCGPTAGYSEGCTAPLPTSGTIMSYCHLVSGVGINFANGFGPQPGDRIRSEVYNAPCLAPCGGGTCNYTTYNTSNFDANWGIWVDGGTDCARINNATYANSPTYSIQLRDNTTTSVMSTGNLNLSAYNELTINFSYIPVSFETGEDFWLQVSTNGGSTYTTRGDFNAGTQFTNNVRQSGSVVIPGPFTSTTRLRFRADASADDDVVYIDDVVVTGCQLQGRGDALTDRENPIALEDGKDNPTGLSNVSVQPNPATEVFHLRLDAGDQGELSIQCIDLAGRVALQQQVRVEKGENRFDLPVSGLANGVYFLQLRSGEDTAVQKVLINR